KGQKDVLKAHAAARGESLNGFVNRCIDEGLARDNQANNTENKELRAWEDFYTNISDSDNEPLPEFERIKFKEIEL
ncbi:MAG: hypothetical protein FWG64_03005, partial [Firmicutes bacterium]|nr:hypothetical protein [Bacillota bacterium]